MDLVVFFTTLGLLFLGELGDKTQLMVFNLALEHENSWKVGVGSTLAFATIITIGIILGNIITTIIPLSFISLVAGIVFVVIGLLEARGLKELYEERIDHSVKNSDHEENQKHSKILKSDIQTSQLSRLRSNPYLSGFILIFLMELGDKSQILTITLASIYQKPVEVWLGSFIALTFLTWMGVLFGAYISQKLPKFYLKLVSVLIFVGIGMLIIITSL